MVSVAAGLLQLNALKSRNLSAYWNGEGNSRKTTPQRSSHQNILHVGEEVEEEEEGEEEENRLVF